ncbi:MAG: hypothetical protein GY854_24530 [Deltaproteobacteria bacterium]|nr:hypothetical protein [Deltaproteobacteria bacterium]
MALAWTPVQSGPGTKGTWEWDWDKGVDSDMNVVRRLKLRWTPTPPGVDCQPTAIIQTARTYFETEDADGNKGREDLNKPSDVFKDVDIDSLPEPTRSAMKRAKTRDEQSRDPNATDSGTIVDALWCDDDPYYNDERENLDNHRGDKTGHTAMTDRPSLDDRLFTGDRKKYVVEFEACAYCYKYDGEVGEVLDCVKWRFVKEKGGDPVMEPPSEETGPPSQEHKDAVKKFVDRHTRERGGKKEAYCPEFEQAVQQAIAELKEEGKINDETPEHERNELILKKIRKNVYGY